MLQQILADDSDDELAEKGSEITLQQLILFKRAYQRLGKWVGERGEGEEHYEELWNELVDLFGLQHHIWRLVDPIKMWSKGVGKKTLGNEGWQAPKSWGFLQ